jgi:hypothetical protein
MNHPVLEPEVAVLVALFDQQQDAASPTAADGHRRWEDPHYLAKIVHAASASLALRLHAPETAAATALRLARSRHYFGACATLMKSGGNLAVGAPQSLALVLAAAPACHSLALAFDENRLVGALVGLAIAVKKDAVVQPMIAMCLKALADGPEAKAVASYLALQPMMLRVVQNLFEVPGLRSAGTSMVRAMLSVDDGRRFCAKHFATLDLLTIGTPLHVRLSKASVKTSLTVPSGSHGTRTR